MVREADLTLVLGVVRVMENWKSRRIPCTQNPANSRKEC